MGSRRLDGKSGKFGESAKSDGRAKGSGAGAAGGVAERSDRSVVGGGRWSLYGGVRCQPPGNGDAIDLPEGYYSELRVAMAGKNWMDRHGIYANRKPLPWKGAKLRR